MSGQPSTAARSAAAGTSAVLDGYLRNFASRLRAGGVYFGDPESDALVSVVDAELGNRMRTAAQRSAVAERLAIQTARGIAAGGLAANAVGYALSLGAAGPLGRDIPTDLIMRALDAGEASAQGSGLWWSGWRVRFLAAAQHVVEEDQVEMCSESLRRNAALVSSRCSELREDPSDIGLCARLAWFAAAPGVGEEPHQAARGLVGSMLARHQGDAVPGRNGECTAPAPTVQLMRLALAARATQHPGDADAITEWVLSNRGAAPNALLRRDSTSSSRLESSPWVALSLACACEPSGSPRQPVETAPGPFEIEAVNVGVGVISYQIRVEGIRTRSAVDARHLNLLCRTALNAACRNGSHPPRRTAHLLNALIALRSHAGDDYTAASMDQLIARSVDRLLADQLPTGGWQPGHLIDVAAAGVALCKAFTHGLDERCRRAALRAADSLERADEPPATTTEALWQTCFYAHLGRIHGSGAAVTQASTDFEDLLIGVRAEAPPSAWHRWLLAEIMAVGGREVAALSGWADADTRLDGAISLGDQLRLVAAMPSLGPGRPAWLRAFGRVVIGHWDEPFASLAVRPAQLPWVIAALAEVAALQELAYRVSLDDVRTADERILLALRRLWESQLARECAQGSLGQEVAPSVLADRANGCAALYRRTRDAGWHAEGMRASELLMAGQHPDGFWLVGDGMPSLGPTGDAGLALLKMAEITRDERLPEAAQRAATWLSGVTPAMCNRGTKQRQAIPLAAVARTAVLVARSPDPSPQAIDAAALCVSTLLEAQDKRGLWGKFAGGPPDEVGIDVIGRLSDLAWSPLGSVEVDRALRIGIDSIWESFFTPHGRGFADSAKDASMSAQWTVVYAAACCDGAIRFADLSLLERASAVLRHTMSIYRAADGDIRPCPGEPPEARCSARCFSELANILERAPDVAEL